MYKLFVLSHILCIIMHEICQTITNEQSDVVNVNNNTLLPPFIHTTGNTL